MLECRQWWRARTSSSASQIECVPTADTTLTLQGQLEAPKVPYHLHFGFHPCYVYFLGSFVPLVLLPYIKVREEIRFKDGEDPVLIKVLIGELALGPSSLSKTWMTTGHGRTGPTHTFSFSRFTRRAFTTNAYLRPKKLVIQPLEKLLSYIHPSLGY